MKNLMSTFVLVFLSSAAFAGNGQVGSVGSQDLSVTCQVVAKDRKGKESIVDHKEIVLTKEEESYCGQGRNATSWAQKTEKMKSLSGGDVSVTLGTMKDSCIAEGPGVIVKYGFGSADTDPSDFNTDWRDTQAFAMNESADGDLLSFKDSMSGRTVTVRCNHK